MRRLATLPLVLLAFPSGGLFTLAGGGRRRPPRDGEPAVLAGQPAIRAQLGRPRAIAVAPDGGVLLSEDQNGGIPLPGLIRYLAPAGLQLLAVALVRDRVFGPGRANAVHVSLTRPAGVTLTVAGHTTTAALGAGESRLPPGLSRRPHAVTLTASDAAGDRAYDRTRIFPERFLPEETALIPSD